MTHPSKSPTRWDGYLAFLYLMSQDRFRFQSDGKAVALDGPDPKLAARTNRNGYRRIPFRFQGRRYEIMEHVAFWIHSKGFPPRGLQVNHRNLDRSNGSLDNLDLKTQGGNIKHAARLRKAGVAGGKR